MAKSGPDVIKGGFRLTAPGLVTLIGYAILLVIVLLPVDMYVYDSKTGQYVKRPYNLGYRLVVALLLLFPFLLSVYSVNCIVTGDCILWAWILGLLTLLWAIVITVVTLSSGAFSLDQLI